ncbi:LysR family transcriptional regulator [Streptomyces sp. NPDC052309]|uniref:LysR family transcriptional regulator n=1 Tax=Streptomyces sp. NPDC052309 TaxID=3155421 RepID=UPI003425ACB4
MAQLERLRYFVVAAEEHNLSRAAKRLYIAQPSLSQQIKRLEGELGVELFKRTRKGLDVTGAGQLLLSRLRPVLLELDDLLAAVHEAGSPAGHLTIRFTPAAGGPLMQRVLRAFAADFPGVTVEPKPHDFTDTSAGLRSGLVDVAFVRRPITGAGLRFMDIITEPRVLAVAADHRFADRDVITINEAFDEPWVTMPVDDPAWRDFWLATEYRDRPAEPGPTAATPDASFLSVASGRGILLTRRSIAARYESEGVRLIDVVDVGPSIGAVAWRATHETRLVRAFVTAARRIAMANHGDAAISAPGNPTPASGPPVT